MLLNLPILPAIWYNIPMDDGGNGLGFLLLGVIGVGALALALDSRNSPASALVPAAHGPQRNPAGAYTNAEEWEITWSPEGLPTKVVIHRNATRS